MEITRADAWLVKGFDGITNLIIQRSQKPVAPDLVTILDEALSNLEIVSGTIVVQPPSLGADFQVFSLLLQLTKVLLARVRADKSFDRANIDALRVYMDTLRKALQRFREHEQCPGGSKDLERTDE